MHYKTSLNTVEFQYTLFQMTVYTFKQENKLYLPLPTEDEPSCDRYDEGLQ